MNREWLKAAIIRAIKTMAQGAVALIGTDMVSIVDINWAQILGCVATMGVLSLLTSIAGLPEVGDDVEVVHYDEEAEWDDVHEVKESEVPHE